MFDVMHVSVIKFLFLCVAPVRVHPAVFPKRPAALYNSSVYQDVRDLGTEGESTFIGLYR
jgi:hypothetical protein